LNGSGAASVRQRRNPDQSRKNDVNKDVKDLAALALPFMMCAQERPLGALLLVLLVAVLRWRP
jgi:hypothetical protein